MARLLGDENFPVPVAQHLSGLGYDVVTVHDFGIGGLGRPDPEVLETAIREGRAVLMYDRLDFRRLHRARPDHAGIVICTFNRDFRELAHCVHETLQEHSDLKGRLVRVYRPVR